MNKLQKAENELEVSKKKAKRSRSKKVREVGEKIEKAQRAMKKPGLSKKAKIAIAAGATAAVGGVLALLLGGNKKNQVTTPLSHLNANNEPPATPEEVHVVEVARNALNTIVQETRREPEPSPTFGQQEPETSVARQTSNSTAARNFIRLHRDISRRIEDLRLAMNPRFFNLELADDIRRMIRETRNLVNEIRRSSAEVEGTPLSSLPDDIRNEYLRRTSDYVDFDANSMKTFLDDTETDLMRREQEQRRRARIQEIINEFGNGQTNGVDVTRRVENRRNQSSFNAALQNGTFSERGRYGGLDLEAVNSARNTQVQNESGRYSGLDLSEGNKKRGLPSYIQKHRNASTNRMGRAQVQNESERYSSLDLDSKPKLDYMNRIIRYYTKH